MPSRDSGVISIFASTLTIQTRATCTLHAVQPNLVTNVACADQRRWHGCLRHFLSRVSSLPTRRIGSVYRGQIPPLLDQYYSLIFTKMVCMRVM